MDWKKTSFVLRGRIRQKVLKCLESPKTATIVSKEINTHRSTVSRILLDLEKKKLVICLDKSEPYSRYYKRTVDGEKVLKEIGKIE